MQSKLIENIQKFVITNVAMKSNLMTDPNGMNVIVMWMIEHMDVTSVCYQQFKSKELSMMWILVFQSKNQVFSMSKYFPCWISTKIPGSASSHYVISLYDSWIRSFFSDQKLSRDLLNSKIVLWCRWTHA